MSFCASSCRVLVVLVNLRVCAFVLIIKQLTCFSVDAVPYSECLKYGAHNHPEAPCDECPRHGRCVPKVQCPAHVRPGSHNPGCHIKGHRNLVGVCCFTGARHAAEPDHKARSNSVPSPDTMKKIHELSRKKLVDWLHKSEVLIESTPGTLVNSSSPSFAHHLSVMTYDPMAQKLGQGALLNLFAAQEMKARDVITDEDLSLGFTDNNTDGPFCPPPPVCSSAPDRYRSIGGECNNIAFPSWGAVHSGFERLLPPHYKDGIWEIRSSLSGNSLPSARRVSHNLLLDTNRPSPTHNMIFMQFGQFIAHDLSAGVVFTTSNGSAISCCIGNGEDYQPPDLLHWACAPIGSGPQDPFYGQFGQKCMNFVRTQLAPSSDCSIGYARQMNGNTHFLDLSQIYGSSVNKANQLRNSNGLLNTFNDYGRELPPLTERQECLTQNEGAACFESGDNHGNQVISLTVLHTLYTREHNRVARTLVRLNPGWDGNQLYMETRRIVQAEFQHVVYNEWLPMLLGVHFMKMFDLSPSPAYSSSYDPHVNPALSAEFASAAMRFGHSVVDSKLTVPDTRSKSLYEAVSLPEVMFQPSRLRLRPFIDRLLVGLSHQPMQNVDPFVTESLTRYLFHGGNPFGLDLAAINIHRGRDYGLRPYNDYRRLIGLPPLADFQEYTPNAAKRLSKVYESPEDVDLWLGGLLEEPVQGGILGATFSNIIADQFSKLKKGDRYFYEHGPDVNPGAFTLDQLSEIKKVSFSRLVCDNSDGIELLSMPPNAFLRADYLGNAPVPCNSPIIPSLDLNRFAEI